MRFAGTIKGFNWKYALGETFLIVIGVTIALAASSWYEDQNDRRTEVEYIGRLHAALANDISRFSNFEKVLEVKADTLKALLTKDANLLLSDGASNFMSNLRYSEYKTLPESNTATFDELKSTGKFALIRDPSLRDAVAAVNSELAYTADMMFWLRQYRISAQELQGVLDSAL
jgi:uncharacterized protein DUF6090